MPAFVLPAGEVMPAWLPALLKRRLITEKHHKVLRRLLQLLTAIPATAAEPQAGSQASREHEVSAAGNQNGRSQSLSDHAPNAPQPAQLDDAQHQIGSVQTTKPLFANNTSARQAVEASAGSPGLFVQPASINLSASSKPASRRRPDTAAAGSESSSPLAPPSHGDLGTAAAEPGLSSASSPPSHKESNTTADVDPLAHAVRHYEQILAIMTEARHPTIKREALHCLGAATHSVIATLMPDKDQPQSATPVHSHVHGVDAPRLQQHRQPAASHLSSPQNNTESQQAQLRSSASEDALIGSSPAQLRGSDSVSCHQAQTSTSNEANCKASVAQSQGPEQTAHGLVIRFVALVSRCSEAQQFDDIRLAAAIALAASGAHTSPIELSLAWSACAVVIL